MPSPGPSSSAAVTLVILMGTVDVSLVVPPEDASVGVLLGDTPSASPKV